MPSFNSIAVIGAGAWGTALAGVAARAGRDVVLYARNAESATQIAATRAQSEIVRRAAKHRRPRDGRDRAGRGSGRHPDRHAAQNLREAVTAIAPHLAKATP